MTHLLVEDLKFFHKNHCVEFSKLIAFFHAISLSLICLAPDQLTSFAFLLLVLSECLKFIFKVMIPDDFSIWALTAIPI